MRDLARLIERVKSQLREFSRGLCLGLSAACSRMVSEVLYGLCKSGDVKLTAISRSLRDKASLKKAVERLSRNLSSEDISRKLNRRVVEASCNRVSKDTLLVIDESDLQKRYAHKMEGLWHVRDGSEKKIGWGYPLLKVLSTEVDGRDVIPLWGQLHSTRLDTSGGENAEITYLLRDISERLCGRGIWVMDRGFDRGRLFMELIGLEQRFIVRLKTKRHLRWKQQSLPPGKIRVAMRHRAEVIKKKGRRRTRERLKFGFTSVGLRFTNRRFVFVKIRFDGATKPIFLLTNVQDSPSAEDVLWLIKAYVARWRIEETIRFIKQSYGLEDIRVRSYNALRNMTALVNACANFLACHIGLKAKLEIMARRLLYESKRVAGLIKDFRYYALADGLKEVLRLSTSPWREPAPPPSSQLNIQFEPIQAQRFP